MALLVTVMVCALFHLGGRRLGRYEPLPEHDATAQAGHGTDAFRRADQQPRPSPA